MRVDRFAGVIALVGCIVFATSSCGKSTGTPADSSALAAAATPTMADADRATLLELTERVLADTPYWATQGVQVHGAGPDFAAGLVLVATPDDNPETAEKLRARYGDLVTIRGRDVVHPTMTAPTRVIPTT